MNLHATKTDFIALHALALPVIIEYFLQTMIGTVDIYFAGSVGDNAIAAVSLTNLIVNIFIAVYTAVSVGVTANVSRNVGRNDRERASDAARQSVLLSFLMGGGVGILAFLFRNPILHSAGADANILAFAIPYFKVVAVPSIFLCLLLVLSACLRATGDSVTPMAASILANVLNVGLDWLFMKLGWGVVGLGIATTLSRILAVLLLVWRLSSSKGKISLRGGSWRPDKAMLASIARVGLPAGAEKLIMRFGQLVYNGIIISLGTSAYAAHNVAGNIETYVCIPAIGFGIATATQVGISLGANSVKRARDYTIFSIQIAGVYTILLSFCLYFFAPNLAAHFTQNIESQAYIVMILRFISFFEPCNVLAQVFTNALQGAGDSKFPMISTMFGIWGIRVGVGYLLAIPLGLGLPGIWMAYATDVVLRSLALLLRFHRGKWQNISL